MSNWAIGDIHGCYTELSMLLKMIGFNKEKDKLYLLGDLIDRGDKIMDCVNFAIEGQKEGYVHCILGNHEDMYHSIQTYQDGTYYEDQATKRQIKGKDIQKTLKWIKTLPTYIELEDCILTHAGMLSYQHFLEQDKPALIWNRDLNLIPKELRYNKTIVHGHTPVVYPMLREDRCNIDCGCVYGNKLTALNLDSIASGYFEHESIQSMYNRVLGA